LKSSQDISFQGVGGTGRLIHLGKAEVKQGRRQIVQMQVHVGPNIHKNYFDLLFHTGKTSIKFVKKFLRYHI